MKKTIIHTITTIALLISVISGFAQDNTIGGVSIAIDTLPPHVSAMLDVRSVNKGVLIPRVTLQERNAISPKTDGLTVFVIDEDVRGFWFWNGASWSQLRFQKTVYPVGAIIMYKGSLANFGSSGAGLAGTEMDGWHLCNGQDGTPDMRERFVVGAVNGAGEYGIIGNTGGEDETTLTEDQMFQHSHKVDQVSMQDVKMPHGHELTVPGHSHKFDYSNKDLNNPGMTHIRSSDIKDSDTEEDRFTSYSKTGITIKQNSQTNFQFPTELIDEVGGSVPMENRPPYYVVAYVIRVDAGSGVNFNTLNVAYPNYD